MSRGIHRTKGGTVQERAENVASKRAKKNRYDAKENLSAVGKELQGVSFKISGAERAIRNLADAVGPTQDRVCEQRAFVAPYIETLKAIGPTHPTLVVNVWEGGCDVIQSQLDTVFAFIGKTNSLDDVKKTSTAANKLAKSQNGTVDGKVGTPYDMEALLRSSSDDTAPPRRGNTVGETEGLCGAYSRFLLQGEQAANAYIEAVAFVAGQRRRVSPRKMRAGTADFYRPRSDFEVYGGPGCSSLNNPGGDSVTGIQLQETLHESLVETAAQRFGPEVESNATLMHNLDPKVPAGDSSRLSTSTPSVDEKNPGGGRQAENLTKDISNIQSALRSGDEGTAAKMPEGLNKQLRRATDELKKRVGPDGGAMNWARRYITSNWAVMLKYGLRIAAGFLVFKQMAHDRTGCFRIRFPKGESEAPNHKTKVCDSATWNNNLLRLQPNQKIKEHCDCSCVTSDVDHCEPGDPPRGLKDNGCQDVSASMHPCRRGNDSEGFNYTWETCNAFQALAYTTGAFAQSMGSLVTCLTHTAALALSGGITSVLVVFGILCILYGVHWVVGDVFGKR